MKYRIYYPAILLLLGMIILSSCKKNDRPAQLNTDTNNIVFIQGENTRFFGIVNTGNAAMDFQIESSENFVSISPSDGILGFNELEKIEVRIDSDNLDFGLHEASLYVTSNGGTQLINIQIFKPLPTPAKLWWDIDYIKIPTGSDKDYITIRNDGEETLDYAISSLQSWMSFSPNAGSLEEGQEKIIWVNIDRSGLDNDLHSGVVNILTTNGGNAKIDIDMEVGVYSVTFFNPTYTVIDINVPGQGSFTIPVLDRVNYKYSSNPGSIFYVASTEGETVNNQTLGLYISWQDNINLSDEESPIYDLNIGEEVFFLSAVNYGSHDLDNWSINNGSDYQFDEDVLVPNNNLEYYFGYYDALDNSNVYARIVGTNNDAVWENGKEFDFPWVMNQSILLESSLKSTGAKSSRVFNKTSAQTGTLKMNHNTRLIPRMRDSKSLKNMTK